MAKTSNIYVRIEPQIKDGAEEVLSALGLSPSSAISMFYKQIMLQKGLPFAVKMPSESDGSICERRIAFYPRLIFKGKR